MAPSVLEQNTPSDGFVVPQSAALSCGVVEVNSMFSIQSSSDPLTGPWLFNILPLSCLPTLHTRKFISPRSYSLQGLLGCEKEACVSIANTLLFPGSLKRSSSSTSYPNGSNLDKDLAKYLPPQIQPFSSSHRPESLPHRRCIADPTQVRTCSRSRERGCFDMYDV